MIKVELKDSLARSVGMISYLLGKKKTHTLHNKQKGIPDGLRV